MTANEPGGGAGQAARDHWVSIATDAMAKLRPHNKAAALDHLTQAAEAIERDLGPRLGPLVAHWIDDPAVPDVFKEIIGPLIEPTHLGDSILIGIALGAAISPVLQAGLQPAVQILANQAWQKLPTLPLSPDLAAASVLKGVLTEGAGAAQAIQSGFAGDTFATMVETAGQSIGLAEALLLWRRGQITDAHLTEIIQYSNLNPKFYDDVRALKYTPPSTGAALEGVVKSHLDPATAKQIMAHNGTDPSNYDWMVASTGTAPGVQQVLHLRNRGEATDADVADTIAQSNLNPRFAPLVEKLGEYWPPVRTVVALLRQGAIDDTRATQLLKAQGVQPADITAYIAGAHHTRAATIKQLSAAQIARSYEDQLLTAADAHARLMALGYPAADAQLYLDLADHARIAGFVRGAVNRVRGRYVAYKIDAAAAQADLARLGLAPAAVQSYMTVWGEDRAANVGVLSVAQIQGAYHRGIIDLPHFITRMKDYGHSGVDIKILAAAAWPPTRVPAEVKALDPATL